jgi:5-methyltetrahydropteroyltriglutamate--homocysteine methyltransferase
VKRSSDRILTSHTGVLNLPPAAGQATGPRGERDAAAIARDVNEAVRLQVQIGIDVVNDGQLGGESSLDLTFGAGLLGIEPKSVPEGTVVVPGSRTREGHELADFFERRAAGSIATLYSKQPTCVGPLKLKDPNAIQRELAYFKSALAANPGWQEAFYAIVSPSWLHEVLINEYYRTDEEFIYALADAMRPVYKAVVDAGFLLHIDAPDIAYDWELESHKHPGLTLDEYRKWKQIHVEADNYALEGIPEEKIRAHVCWGSWSAPHMYSVPLQEIADLILRLKAQCLCIEAAKPNHTHEWKVWRDVKIPDGKIFMPGVIDHTTDVREHPEVIADRIINYANVVGRENVIAGTDCGMRGHPLRDWIKYRAIVEGAALASEKLWGRKAA